MIAREPRDGLIGNRRKSRGIEREILCKPGIFRDRENVSERRTFRDSASNEILGLQREGRRLPALRQGCDV